MNHLGLIYNKKENLKPNKYVTNITVNINLNLPAPLSWQKKNWIMEESKKRKAFKLQFRPNGM